jgi:ectoine hydroxylase-related dioxygenase (phytanoyl-CoA dioxygenase family)
LNLTDLRSAVETQGFALAPAALDLVTLKRVLAAMERYDPEGRAGRRGGLRHVVSRVPEIEAVAISPEIRALVEGVLGPEVTLARSLWFDKTAAANWNVAWHQDLTLAVRERIETPGFVAWSVKAGIPHVQPPDEVLERMLAVRLHLDPCGPENGALRVLPGSHRHGRLADEAIDRWRREVPEVLCAAQPGDVLLMHPLLLHASSAAVSPAHRRVLHLEFGLGPLPNGLQWFGG